MKKGFRVVRLPFFICGFVIPWRRFDLYCREWEWTFGGGYWLIAWSWKWETPIESTPKGGKPENGAGV